MQSDDELTFELNANEIYRFTILVLCISPAAADIKLGFIAPAGATVQWTIPTSTLLTLQTLASTPTLATDGANQSIAIEGVIRNGATAGTWAFQWAQATSNAGDTKVLKNTTLMAWRQ